MDTWEDEIDEVMDAFDKYDRLTLSDLYEGSSDWKPLPKAEETKKKEAPDRSKDPTFGSW